LKTKRGFSGTPKILFLRSDIKSQKG